MSYRRNPCVYILTNKTHTTLYTGVTANLFRRIGQHTFKHHKNSFSARYNCNKLVYFEFFQTMPEAIAREKQIKGKMRSWKNRLIESKNTDWLDLKDKVRW